MIISLDIGYMLSLDTVVLTFSDLWYRNTIYLVQTYKIQSIDLIAISAT
jgi:hypothetical protein